MWGSRCLKQTPRRGSGLRQFGVGAHFGVTPDIQKVFLCVQYTLSWLTFSLALRSRRAFLKISPRCIPCVFLWYTHR